MRIPRTGKRARRHARDPTQGDQRSIATLVTKKGFSTPDRCLMTGFKGFDPKPSFAEGVIDITLDEVVACEELMVEIAKDAGEACTEGAYTLPGTP